jgi:F0F1-type ATP synthase alpha subunit
MDTINYGQIYNYKQYTLDIVLVGTGDGVTSGCYIKGLNEPFTINIEPNIIGTIIDTLGNIIYPMQKVIYNRNIIFLNVLQRSFKLQSL